MICCYSPFSFPGFKIVQCILELGIVCMVAKYFCWVDIRGLRDLKGLYIRALNFRGYYFGDFI